MSQRKSSAQTVQSPYVLGRKFECLDKVIQFFEDAAVHFTDAIQHADHLADGGGPEEWLRVMEAEIGLTYPSGPSWSQLAEEIRVARCEMGDDYLPTLTAMANAMIWAKESLDRDWNDEDPYLQRHLLTQHVKSMLALSEHLLVAARSLRDRWAGELNGQEAASHRRQAQKRIGRPPDAKNAAESQKMLELYDTDEWTYPQLGEAFGVSGDAAAKRVRRAREKRSQGRNR